MLEYKRRKEQRKRKQRDGLSVDDISEEAEKYLQFQKPR